ncbi:MAG: glycosyltransferase [Turneriella sp.]|nr:glycosyltransferase [Turneriella sp.]
MRILFITQTMDVTGSELVLANILNNLDPQKIEAGVFISQRPGLLANKLPSHIQTFSLQEIGQRTFSRLFKLILLFIHQFKIGRILRTMLGIRYFENTYEKNLLRHIFRKYRYDLIYFNSIVFPDMMHFAYREKMPYILHTHELAHVLANIPTLYEDALIKGPVMILATSRAAAQVINEMGRQGDIEVWNPGIDFQKLKSITSHPFFQNTASPPRSEFHWFGSGYSDLNKNVLLFLFVAKQLVNSGLKVRFTWIGLSNNQLYDRWIVRYRDSLGLQKYVQFLEKQENNDSYYKILATADAVMIPSFRESFSLVAVEAIFLGKPVLAFANGGSAEYLSKRNGLTAKNYDYADFIAQAKKMMLNHKYYLRAKMQGSVKKFDIRTRMPIWESLICKNL